MVQVCNLALAFVSAVGFAGAALAQTGGYKQIYAFQGGSGDGLAPQSGLLAVGGLLYGTTYGGAGNGTVFSVNPATGAEKIVFAFRGTGDGKNPRAALIDVNGLLYGTTSGGGDYNNGAVFSVDPHSGAEKLIYSFLDRGDGATPVGSLVNVGGKLYGTTQYGGSMNCSGGCGTVYSIDLTTNAETIVHVFTGGYNDGSGPQAGLLHLAGRLYGTTEYGGSGGLGTVFFVNIETGHDKLVHSFQGGRYGDGAYPLGTLIKVGATLYGTTYEGGVSYTGFGTVFALTLKTGVEKAVYAFQGGSTDGQYPYGRLTSVGGMLYGTTSGGGAGTCTFACGVLFSLNPATSAEQVLHVFQGNSDGGKPAADMIKVGTMLYGTTEQGGDTTTCAAGCGTVFALTP